MLVVCGHCLLLLSRVGDCRLEAAQLGGHTAPSCQPLLLTSADYTGALGPGEEHFREVTRATLMTQLSVSPGWQGVEFTVDGEGGVGEERKGWGWEWKREKTERGGSVSRTGE